MKNHDITDLLMSRETIEEIFTFFSFVTNIPGKMEQLFTRDFFYANLTTAWRIKLDKNFLLGEIFVCDLCKVRFSLFCFFKSTKRKILEISSI